jgi:hypothetical protein
MSNLKKYSVLAVCDETGQIVIHHVLAASSQESFALVSRVFDLEMVASLKGWVVDGEEIVVPGLSTVSSSTITEQADVFGEVEGFYIDEDFTIDPYWVKAGGDAGKDAESAYFEAGGEKYRYSA